MERDLYREICRWLADIHVHFNPHETYNTRRVVEVLAWAVLHDRPVSWACQAAAWPPELRGRPRPSQSRMSRRLRTQPVRDLIVQLACVMREQLPRGFIKYIDAKPLPVGGCSGDRDARYGRAAGGKCRGYKIVTITDACGAVDDWTLTAMNTPEHHAARDLIARMPGAMFLIGDNAYDKNELYDLAAERQTHLVGAFKKKARNLGHHRHSPHRVAAFELQKTDDGQALVKMRSGIERSYGNLVSFPGGLAPLPAHVRRPHRVALWVQLKLIADYARRALRLQAITTSAA